MKIRCTNIEPDGRLLIEKEYGSSFVAMSIPVGLLAEFIDGLRKYCSNEGDGGSFVLKLESEAKRDEI